MQAHRTPCLLLYPQPRALGLIRGKGISQPLPVLQCPLLMVRNRELGYCSDSSFQH